MPKNHQPNDKHQPVLSKEVLECLKPRAGESYLDLTAGYGGHAALVLAATGAPQISMLVDRDAQAVDTLKHMFPRARVEQIDFATATQRLAGENKQFNMILADLGASSPHFDTPSRGFAHQLSGPLDMRMDQRQEVTAAKLVNEATEQALAGIIKNFGEEPRAAAIARRIVQNRPITDTIVLADIVRTAVGPLARRRKIHPATRTFQALRIAVNNELTQLETAMPLMHQLLAPGGRLAIISFHSLEDRVVKRYFSENAGDRYDTDLRLLTKKPLTASRNELLTNPRARSAKLRAVAKIKT